MDTLRLWKKSMLDHNRTVERGERMRLIPFAGDLSRLKFGSLDLYMLQMHSRYLSQILDEFSNFGDRVLTAMQGSPTAARFWIIKAPILIERVGWQKLCSQVISLLRALDLEKSRNEHLDWSRWPDHDLLEAAAARAYQLFGPFAHTEMSAPSTPAPPRRLDVREAGGPPPAGTSRGALAAGQRRRSGSRPPAAGPAPRPGDCAVAAGFAPATACAAPWT